MTCGFFVQKKSKLPAVFALNSSYWKQELTTKKWQQKKREKEDGEKAENDMRNKKEKKKDKRMLGKITAGMMLAAAMIASAAVMPGSEHGLAVRAYAANVSNQNSQNISGGVQRIVVM